MNRVPLQGCMCAAVAALLVATGCQKKDGGEPADTARSAASPAGGAERGRSGAPLVFVSNEDSENITIIDSGTDSVIATIPVGKRPRGIRLGPDGKSLFVAVSGSPKAGPEVDESKLPPPDRAADGVAVIDVATLRLVKTLPSGNDPESFAISNDGKTVYVSNEDAGTVSVLDVESGKVTNTITVGEEPEGVTMRPDGKAVYVTSEGTGSVAVIDADQRKVVATIATGKRPRSTVFTPDGTKAYMTAELGGTVTVVDTKTNKPLKTISVPDSGAKPMGSAISPDGKWVYITNGRGGTLSVIDAATRRVIRTVGAGRSPWGIAIGR